MRESGLSADLPLRENHSGMETESLLHMFLDYHRCVRTIVVWKQRRAVVAPRNRPRCVRTIVVWKR